MLASVAALHTAYTPTLHVATPQLAHAMPRRSAVPVLNMQRVQSAALGAALATTLAVNSASAADPWPYSTLLSKVQTDAVAKVAFSDDGTKVVAFDQEGRDHQVNVFPGGDAELVGELRKHNVQFAVVPPRAAARAAWALAPWEGRAVSVSRKVRSRWSRRRA